MEMVSLAEEIVSENLNAEENLPALLLPLDLINTLPVSFTCTAREKKKRKKKDVFLLAYHAASSQEGRLCSGSELHHQKTIRAQS